MPPLPSGEFKSPDFSGLSSTGSCLPRTCALQRDLSVAMAPAVFSPVPSDDSLPTGRAGKETLISEESDKTFV